MRVPFLFKMSIFPPAIGLDAMAIRKKSSKLAKSPVALKKPKRKPIKKAKSATKEPSPAKKLPAKGKGKQNKTELPHPSEDNLSIYLREIRKNSLLDREMEHELAIKARDENDEEAFNKLVQSNLRYVVSVANRYKGFGLPLEDLINEGNIGLIHAVRRFDPDRGVKLITYAVWWIRQSIMRILADHAGTVRLPIKQAGLMRKIGIAHQTLRQRLDRDATTDEISSFLNLKTEDVENVMRVYRTYLSLDAPISIDDETNYIELLEEENAISAEENLFQHALEDEIEDLLQGLDPREREIIRMRFGFDGEPMTFEEIGHKIGLSRERIRQIEKKSIHLFRTRARSKTLLDFLR